MTGLFPSSFSTKKLSNFLFKMGCISLYPALLGLSLCLMAPVSQARGYGDVYTMLLADIAMDRGLEDLSWSLYQEQALQEADPIWAQKATVLALDHEDMGRALASALLWTQRDPDNQEALIILAMLWTMQSQAEKAKESLRLVFSGAEAASLLPETRADPLLLLRLYYEYIPEPFKQEAALLLTQLHREYAPAPAQQQILSLLLADIAFSQGELSVSMGYLGPLLRLSTVPQDVHVLHSLLLRETEQTAVAGLRMAQTLKYYPQYHRLRQDYINLLLEQGETLEAQKQWGILLQYQWASAESLYSLAQQALSYDWPQQAFLAVNRLEEQMARQALLDSEQIAWISYLYAQIYEQEQNFSSAIQRYLSIDKQSILYKEAALQGAVLLVREGRAREALSILSDLMFLTLSVEEKKEIRLQLIQLYAHTADLESAILALKEGLAESPQDADYLAALESIEWIEAHQP